MAVKLTKFCFSFAFLAILALSFASATTWHRFEGTQITIGSNTSTNGSFVAVYINGVMKANCTAGRDQGCVSGAASWARTPFVLDVTGGTTGATVIITVYNVTANNTYTFSDGSITKLNLTISQLADSAVCAYSEACSGGYCCSGATEYHGNGIGACQATACTAPTTPPPSGGTSGGGGGGVTEEGVSQTKYSGLVGTGGTKEITYTRDELKITGITLTAASQIDNAGITVTESTAGKAGIAISAGEGGTYKYLTITKLLITDSQISKVKISFKVEKSWYTTNNYDISSTVMRRKVGDAWQDLPTTKISEDATYYYFEAESPGLSYFAVTAKKIGAAVTPPEGKKAVCGDGVCELDETCSNCAADCGCATGKECVNDVCQEKVTPITITPTSRIKLILIGAGILFVLAIVIILLAMPKKKKKF